jgi:hypothetical protein
VTSFPLLGVVSAAFPSRQKRQFRGRMLRFSFATGCLTAAFCGALALNWVGARLTAQAIRALVKI